MENEDFSDLTLEELQTKIDEAQDDPYYGTSRPEGKPANQQKHDRAVQKVSKLFDAKHPSPEPTEEDKQVPQSVKDLDRAIGPYLEEAMAEKAGRDEAAQEKLQDELAEELEVLQDLNEDADYPDYEEVTVPLIEGYRSLRLLAQGDLQKAIPLIRQTAQAALKASGSTAAGHQRIAQLEQFLNITTTDPEDVQLLTDIVAHIYELRNSYS